ncbi:hypothetical protein C6Y14_42985 [Streptomyces dioscori]|uniref:Lipoprotein n=1 Tax=Streptomyces dioscori TaxID=2109333 RepID=A0A2P8PTI7_9ACTN|nr:hypothetical protein C6Y14_42985 [Streptomyces dioscori]
MFGTGAGACGTGVGSGSATSTTATEQTPVLTPAEAVAEAAEDSAGITSLRYRITGSVPDRGRLRGEASMATKPSAMSMELTTADQRAKGPMEVRFVGKALYFGGSALDDSALVGDKWGLDESGLAQLRGRSWLRAEPAAWGRGVVDNNTYGVLPRQIEGSPVVQSTILTGSRNPKRIGTETVDGTRTVHYRGTVTSEGLRASRDAVTGKAARKRQIDSLDHFYGLRLDKNLTMDLWIDGDGRAKQFRMRGATYTMPYATDGKPLKPGIGDPIDLTFTFLDINEPVTVRTPPAGDTVDLAALADTHVG